MSNCNHSNDNQEVVYGCKPKFTCEVEGTTCRTVVLFNDTCNKLSNVMWLTLYPYSSVGISIKEWMILSQNEIVTNLLDNETLRVEFDA